MICAMVMAFRINAKLSGIYLVAVAVLGVILFFIIRHATGSFQQAFPKYDELNMRNCCKAMKFTVKCMNPRHKAAEILMKTEVRHNGWTDGTRTERTETESEKSDC